MKPITAGYGIWLPEWLQRASSWNSEVQRISSMVDGPFWTDWHTYTYTHTKHFFGLIQMFTKEQPGQWRLLHDIFCGYYSASFFSKPYSCLNGLWTKWWWGWRVCTDLVTEAFAHQNSSGYSRCWVPALQKQRPALSSGYGTVSWGTSQPPGGILITLDHLSWFVVIGIGIYSGFGLAFATQNASWKNHNTWAYRTLY